MKAQAESMKMPSSAASIAYSGQCLAKVAAARRSVEGLGEAAAHPRSFGEVVISSVRVTRHGIRRQAGSDRKSLSPRESSCQKRVGCIYAHDDIDGQRYSEIGFADWMEAKKLERVLVRD